MYQSAVDYFQPTVHLIGFFAISLYILLYCDWAYTFLPLPLKRISKALRKNAEVSQQLKRAQLGLDRVINKWETDEEYRICLKPISLEMLDQIRLDNKKYQKYQDLIVTSFSEKNLNTILKEVNKKLSVVWDIEKSHLKNQLDVPNCFRDISRHYVKLRSRIELGLKDFRDETDEPSETAFPALVDGDINVMLNCLVEEKILRLEDGSYSLDHLKRKSYILSYLVRLLYDGGYFVNSKSYSYAYAGRSAALFFNLSLSNRVFQGDYSNHLDQEDQEILKKAVLKLGKGKKRNETELNQLA